MRNALMGDYPLATSDKLDVHVKFPITGLERSRYAADASRI
jgi:hypothetical protein